MSTLEQRRFTLTAETAPSPEILVEIRQGLQRVRDLEKAMIDARTDDEASDISGFAEELESIANTATSLFVSVAANSALEYVHANDIAAMRFLYFSAGDRKGRFLATASDYQGISAEEGVVIGGIYNGVTEAYTLEALFDDPRVLPFQGDRSTEERVLLFQEMQRPLVRRYLEDQLNVRFADLNMRAQLQCIEYLVSGDRQLIEILSTITHRDGLEAAQFLQLFFSLTESVAMAVPIIEAGTTLPVSELNDIARGYNGAMRGIEVIEQRISEAMHLKNQLDTSAVDRVDTRRVAQVWVQRANRVLKKTLSEPAFVEQLFQGIERDAFFFSALLTETLKQRAGDFSFEDFVGVSYEQIDGAVLAVDETGLRDQCLSIARDHYAKASPVLVERLRTLLFPENPESQQRLEQNQFSFVLRNGRVEAFLRAQPAADDSVFVAALQVHPTMQGAGIGEVLLDRTVVQFAKERLVRGTVVPEIQAGVHYVETLGNTLTGFAPPQTTGTPYGWFTMELDLRPDAAHYVLRSPEKTPDVLEAESRINLDEDAIAKILTERPQYVVMQYVMQTPEDIRVMTDRVRQMLEAGEYRVVRMFGSAADATQRLYGFERVPQSEK